MNEVRRVVRKAAWRLWCMDLVQTLAVTITVALAALLLARVTEQVLGIRERFEPWWRWAWMGAGGAALLAAVAWTTIRRRRAIAVAVELDERAGLREALSTAMYMHKSDDPWSRTMVETADARAKGLDVRRALPFRAPALWPVPLATGAALALVWWLFPNIDLLGATKVQVAQEEKQKEVTLVKAEVQNKEKILKEMLSKAKVEFTEEKTELASAEKKPELNDPEAIRRAAVKKLTDLTNKLEQEKTGEKAAQADAIKDAMKQLKQPGNGPLDDFSKSLARGDFNKAQEQLAQLSKEMSDGKMTPEQQALSKKQLEDLAKQLQKLAEDQKQVEKKMEGQGLDKKSAQELAKIAATNPQDLQKALEAMKNLTPEQKKKLLDMAKAAAKCQGACQNMSKSMSKAAQGMSQEGLQQEGMEGMEGLAKELSEAEMMSSDMENLDAALAEAKNQLKGMGELLAGACDKEGNCEGSGNSPWREGSSNKTGHGSGGPGHSTGAFGPEQEVGDYKLDKKKANTQNTGGPIIGTRFVNGPQVRGESVAEYSAAVQAGAQEAAESIEAQQIPREMQDAVKHYFGTLGEKVKATSTPATTPASTSAPAAKPK